MKNLDNIGKCKWRKSPEATLHYSSNKNKGWQLVRNGRCCFMPANITAAETCCGSQCRTAQMKEMKTPKGALRCFFFSSLLGCCCFSSFPHHHQPPCYLHYGLISRHVSLVKKNGNSRTPETSAHPAHPMSTPSSYWINFSIADWVSAKVVRRGLFRFAANVSLGKLKRRRDLVDPWLSCTE